MMYLDTVQLEKITFRMVKERVLGVIPVLIQAHSNQEGRTDQGLAIEAGGSNGSDVAKEEIDNNEDGKVNAEPVEDDEVPLAAAESDRVLSTNVFGIDKSVTRFKFKSRFFSEIGEIHQYLARNYFNILL